MYLIVTIDSIGYNLPLSQEPGVQKLMSNNLNLSEGLHTLTKAQLFNEDNVLISEDLTSQEFTLTNTFTEEIGVNLPLSQGGNTGSTDAMQIVIMATGVIPSIAYFKTQEGQAPPLPTQETINLMGWLGVPEADLPLYTNPSNSMYHVNNPVTSKMKAHLDMYVRKNGIVLDWTMGVYGQPTPLVYTFEKSGNHNDLYEIVVAVHRAMIINEVKHMTNVNGTTNIPFRGDEEVPKDAEGMTKVYVRPEGWTIDPDVEVNWDYEW